MGYALYWIQPDACRCIDRQNVDLEPIDLEQIDLERVEFEHVDLEPKDYPMTYLEVVFRYDAVPGESALRAIDGMREVYGVRRVQFNEHERTVRVEFDASRLRAEAVARLLRQAGVDGRGRAQLA